MDLIYGLAGVLPLLLIGGVVAVIVAVVRRGQGSRDPGIGTTRRLFLYGLAFVALMLGASGITLLAAGLLETLSASRDLSNDAAGTAFGLAATIVGFSVWALVWLAAQRTLAQYPAEAGTVGRKLYAYAVVGVSAAVVAVTLANLLRRLLQPSDFEAEGLAPILVWGALWAFHWRWESREGQSSQDARSVRRLHAYLTSTYGLVMLTVGTGTLLGVLTGAAYDGLFRDRLLGGAGDALWHDQSRTALAVALVGGLWWAWHWFGVSAHDLTSDLRRVVVHIVGIFGGLITVVAGTASALFAVLIWLMDRPRFATAAEHFDVLPVALTTVLVAGGVWGYHVSLSAVEESSVSKQAAARRTYRYLSAVVGLGTLAVGLVLLIGVAVGALTPTIAGGRWWATPLATSITLIIVGTPLWIVHWARQQAAMTAGAPGEADSLPRRAYLFGTIGVAVLATLGAFSAFLFQVIEAALEGRLSTSVLDDAKWAVGVAVAAALFGAYHWQVLREDRALEPPVLQVVPATAPFTKEVTAVAPASARALVEAIARRLGTEVTRQERRDSMGAPELSEAELDQLAERVRSAAGERILLVIDGDGVQVIPL